MTSTSTSTAAAPLRPLPTTEDHSPALLAPRPRHPSVSSFTTQTSASTVAQGPLTSDVQIPVWLKKHMRFWKIPPTTVQARAWMLEAFDYFNSGGYELPYQLRGIETELKREWRRQNAEAQSATTPGAKRKSDAASSSANKRTKTGTTIKSEETSAVSMPPPSRKPLGTLKGKYAIESLFACCDSHTQRAHEEICSVVLSPGNGTTMRGYFNMGVLLDQYKALIFFEKRPSESSSGKVWFRWRGRHVCNDFKEYRGDENRGWMKFLGDGKIEVWFDKFNMRLVAQKGRGIGGRNQHDASGFWEDWHELDDEGMDILDRLAPRNRSDPDYLGIF
ncbi:Ff.00g002280.m01.CDS01 [Fusarium sp. VM40]|nr:Ff.00g002280.m01.CDS01 [Fusarium sp. VM40]